MKKLILPIILIFAGAVYLLQDVGRGFSSPAVLLILAGGAIAIVVAIAASLQGRPANKAMNGWLGASLVLFAVTLIGVLDVFTGFIFRGFDGLIWIYLAPLTFLGSLVCLAVGVLAGRKAGR